MTALSTTRTAITIGNFDGVHAGHRALVAAAREAAGPDGRVVAITFDPHPVTVLRPGVEVQRLTIIDQRTRLLHDAGADAVVPLEPTPELLGKSPEAFLAWIGAEYGPADIVEGEDFRFGRARAGDFSTLRALGPELGLTPRVVDPVSVALRDQTVVRASSTMTRWLIGNGRVRDAALLLQRPYAITGEVVRGDRRGRTIGVPTANIESRHCMPGDGVYAGVAHLPDGRRFAAAVNAGSRPTVNGHAYRLEAHLLGASDCAERFQPIPGLDEYGWPIELELITWVRDQVKFASFEHLRDQLARDIERVRTLAGPALDASAVGSGAA